MTSSRRTIVLVMLVAALASGRARADSATDRECQFGVMLALQGRLVAADSVFTSLLAHSPGDARALTNLGNIRLLSGERDVALEFYASAARADSADPGIVLDRGITLYLMGRDSLARVVATRATVMAGGETQALGLVGVRARDVTDADMSAPMHFPIRAARAGQRTVLTRSDLRTLARAETGREASTVKRGQDYPASPSQAVPEAGGQVSVALEPASNRGSASALYWKH